jgi:oligopeptide transport system substrate-binding protein
MKAVTRRAFAARVAAGAFAAASMRRGSAAPASATLRRARAGSLTTLDPHRPISAADMDIVNDLFEGLTAVDARGEIVPACASRWTVSADALEYRFELRTALRWSDGAPLTAADVVASFRRLLAPQTGALLAYRFDAIRGARALRRGATSADQLGVVADGEGSVRVLLQRPETDLLKLVAIAYVVPTHVIERQGSDWAKVEHIVVNGAYRPVSWSQGGTLTLARNPRFRNASQTRCERVDWVMGVDDATRLRLFRSGELQVAQLAEGAQYALAQRELSTALRSAPAYGGGWLGLNLRRAALADQRVRTALSLATDRALLVQRVRALGESASESLVPDAVRDYPQRIRTRYADWPMPRRLAAARALLTAAGIEAARPRRLVGIYSASTLTQRTFLALDAMWAPLGVRLEARGLESRAYNVALTQRDFDLMDYGPFSVVQSPASFIGRFRSDSFLNYSGYTRGAVDLLVDTAESQTQPAARAAGYAEIERLLLQDLPVIPLYSGVTHCLVASAVEGWPAQAAFSLPSRFLALKSGG